MLNDKKLQARNLYSQTDLTKTQIANLLHISRRSLHYWIREGNWERLKYAAEHLPSILAENVYHIFGHLTETYLSELRATNPLSHKEADTLHKLVITIGKLKNRTTLNENMEMFAFFLEGLRKQSPKMADDIAPYVDDYLASRASVYMNSVMPDTFTEMRRIPWQQKDNTEQQLDNRYFFDADIARLDAIEAEKQQALTRQSSLQAEDGLASQTSCPAEEALARHSSPQPEDTQPEIPFPDESSVKLFQDEKN